MARRTRLGPGPLAAVPIAVLLLLASMAAAEITYSRVPSTDTSGFAIERIGTPEPCGTFFNLPPCNITYLEEACRTSCGCACFNSDGWLKGCCNTSCGATIEPGVKVDTYIGSATARPPIPDLPPIADTHYPASEATETASLPKIRLVSVNSSDTPPLATFEDVKSGQQETAAAVAGRDTLFNGSFRLLAVLTAANPVLAVVESRFAHFSLLRYYAAGAPATAGAALELRSGIGQPPAIRQRRVDAKTLRKYLPCAASSPNDYIGDYLVNSADDGEPTFAKMAAYLAPVSDYGVIGRVNSPRKWSVSPDGRIKRADGNIYVPMSNASDPGPGMLVFDPRAFAAGAWPADNFTDIKSALLGRYLRAVHTAAWDQRLEVGFDQLALAAAGTPEENMVNAPPASAGYKPRLTPQTGVLVRLATNVTATGPANSSLEYRYFFAEDSEPTDWALHNTSTYAVPANSQPAPVAAADFYAALLAYAQPWQEFFAGGMQVELDDGPEGQRLVDMSRGLIVSAMSVWVGNHPNYGDGLNYWGYNVSDNGSLPLTSLALDGALLQWGLADAAADRVGYYLDTYVFANGSLNLMHWKDYCVFADSFSDYGRMLDLFVQTARVHNSAEWAADTMLPATINMTRYVLGLVRVARANHSLIVGPGEHDVCQTLTEWFSVNFWAWRGLSEAALLFLGLGIERPLVEQIARELEWFERAMDTDIQHSLVNRTQGGPGGALQPGKGSTPFFLPPMVGRNQTPFDSMVDGWVASYSNFRFYSEMLSSGFLDDTLGNMLADFRESHTGTLTGMTRFDDWLDDMPAVGYAESDLRLGRKSSFQTIMIGHAANYLSPGVFQSSEQLAFTGSGRYRDFLNDETTNEVDIDLCVPSSILLSRSVAFALLLESKDDDLVYLARGAPHRWFTGRGLTVTRAGSRFGPVNFTIQATAAAQAAAAVVLDLTGAGCINPATAAPVVAVHLRAASASARLAAVAVVAGEGEVLAVDPADNVAFIGLSGQKQEQEQEQEQDLLLPGRRPRAAERIHAALRQTKGAKTSDVSSAPSASGGLPFSSAVGCVRGVWAFELVAEFLE